MANCGRTGSLLIRPPKMCWPSAEKVYMTSSSTTVSEAAGRSILTNVDEMNRTCRSRARARTLHSFRERRRRSASRREGGCAGDARGGRRARRATSARTTTRAAGPQGEPRA
eukprot:2195962-Prymnesium_polylepis.1